SPSPFATLLRRSKFASYDPKIGQVYTTFGGDAHRGNYGVKRPLALRTREPFITIASVDSLQQQTEWSHAEREARWIRKVAEVSSSPEVADGSDLWKKLGPNAKSQWKVNSDFALGTADPASEVEKASQDHIQAGIPNIDAMSPKQFQRYLESLRALRPAFHKFVEAERARTSKVQSSNLLEQSRYPTEIHKIFLSNHSAQRVNDPDSKILEQDAHPNGALTYTHLTKLEHYFWRQPLPGRVVGKMKTLTASFAGFNTRLPPSQSEGLQPIDWRSLVERGVDTGKGISKFRVSLMEVSTPPRVVGHKPDGISNMDVRMHVSSHGRLDMVRANPHLPWTRDYVSQ
ncbi:mitochondrial ribosomal protein subunit-domain-containing protein, partial [Thelephora terrestris]